MKKVDSRRGSNTEIKNANKGLTINSSVPHLPGVLDSSLKGSKTTKHAVTLKNSSKKPTTFFKKPTQHKSRNVSDLQK